METTNNVQWRAEGQSTPVWMQHWCSVWCSGGREARHCQGRPGRLQPAVPLYVAVYSTPVQCGYTGAEWLAALEFTALPELVLYKTSLAAAAAAAGGATAPPHTHPYSIHPSTTTSFSYYAIQKSLLSFCKRFSSFKKIIQTAKLHQRKQALFRASDFLRWWRRLGGDGEPRHTALHTARLLSVKLVKFWREDRGALLEWLPGETVGHRSAGRPTVHFWPVTTGLIYSDYSDSDSRKVIRLFLFRMKSCTF